MPVGAAGNEDRGHFRPYAREHLQAHCRPKGNAGRLYTGPALHWQHHASWALLRSGSAHQSGRPSCGRPGPGQPLLHARIERTWIADRRPATEGRLTAVTKGVTVSIRTFELPDLITSSQLTTFEFSPTAKSEATALLSAEPDAIFQMLMQDQESESALLAARRIIHAFLDGADHFAAVPDGIAEDADANTIAAHVGAVRDELAAVTS